jgi:multiple sugar transport system substrate-binding protein
MVVWSSFILDELAGLRKDATPSCPQCKADPTFLARNSGIVTAIKGPSGNEPAQFGELTSWAIPRDTQTASAKKYVQFMMDEGYSDWLGIAPEGKFPARTGDKTDKKKFATTWDTLPAGVDTKKPLGQIYPPDVISALRSSADTVHRWGITQGQGALVGATVSELPIPKALNAMVTGQTDARGAAKQAADEVRALSKSLN